MSNSTPHSPDRHYVAYPPRSGTSLGSMYSTATPRPLQHQQHVMMSSQSSPPLSYTSSSSPYPASYPMDRMSHVSQSYVHSLPPVTTGPQTQHGSGYLDAFSGLQMDVMGMDMDPTLGMDLSVISAQEHPDAQMLEERGSRSGDDHFSSDYLPEAARQAKGRRRRAQSDDSDLSSPAPRGGKKQRGRPRLDTKDENAADRRRTQIRLAQRAYRLRKETTISSLRTRVSELENAIEGMQSTFLELHDSAMDCIKKNNNENAELYAPNLRELTQRFLGLAKGALGSAEGDSPDEETNEESEEPQRSGGSGEHQYRRNRDDDCPDGGSGSGNSFQLSTDSARVPQFGGYQLSYDRETGNQGGSHGQGSQRPQGTPEYHQTPCKDDFTSLPASSGGPGTEEPTRRNSFPELETTFSYSFQEPSSSRQSEASNPASSPSEHPEKLEVNSASLAHQSSAIQWRTERWRQDVDVALAIDSTPRTVQAF